MTTQMERDQDTKALRQQVGRDWQIGAIAGLRSTL